MATEAKPFKQGLIVGKFSPLHLGHEWLIQQAEKACESLLLLSWSKPSFAGCDSARRRRWLRERFGHLQILVLDDDELSALASTAGVLAPPLPDNEAPASEQREFVGWVCEHLLHIVPDAVFTSETYGEGFAAHLTNYFRQRQSGAGRVVHHCIDAPRQQVPICGTALREDIHNLRAFLAPAVYADFVERIVLLGGESTGKTTLAAALSQALATPWVAEYGRELWEIKGGALGREDMLHIAQTQVARECSLAQSAQRYLVCDSSPLTTLFYALHLFGQADAQLLKLADRRYAQVFLCAADFPFVQDGTRQGASFRAHQQQWYREQLAARNIPYIELTGSVTAREQQVLNALGING